MVCFDFENLRTQLRGFALGLTVGWGDSFSKKRIVTNVNIITTARNENVCKQEKR